MLSEIIIEGCLEQREDGFKDRFTFVQKTKEEEREERDNNLTEINYMVVIQPKRDFKQEESINQNNQSQSNHNKSVNKSINQNPQEQQKIEIQDDVIDGKEEPEKEQEEE